MVETLLQDYKYVEREMEENVVKYCQNKKIRTRVFRLQKKFVIDHFLRRKMK